MNMSSMVPMKHLAPGSGDPEGRATRQEFVQRSGARLVKLVKGLTGEAQKIATALVKSSMVTVYIMLD